MQTNTAIKRNFGSFYSGEVSDGKLYKTTYDRQGKKTGILAPIGKNIAHIELGQQLLEFSSASSADKTMKSIFFSQTLPPLDLSNLHEKSISWKNEASSYQDFGVDLTPVEDQEAELHEYLKDPKSVIAYFKSLETAFKSADNEEEIIEILDDLERLSVLLLENNIEPFNTREKLTEAIEKYIPSMQMHSLQQYLLDLSLI